MKLDRHITFISQ